MSEDLGAGDPRPDGPTCVRHFRDAEWAVGGLYFCSKECRDEYFGYEVTGAGRSV